MYRALIKFVAVASLATIAGVGGWWWWGTTEDKRAIVRLEEQKRELETQKQQLQQIVTRLGSDKRVADLIVTDRQKSGDQITTTLLFVEYDRSGKPLEPRQFKICGEVAHVEAMVIEFQRDFLIADDPLRGHAVALFTRIFGDQQTPTSAERIDAPGQIPTFYRNSSAETSAFETKLWDKFWQLERDTKLRDASGVKVAVGKGVWGPFDPDTLYTITLQPDGNLSRTAEPIRGVYRSYIDMLKTKVATTPAHSPPPATVPSATAATPQN
jgi:hypothetical protein